MYAGLNQHTGELMAVKVLELVPRGPGQLADAAAARLAELQVVGLWLSGWPAPFLISCPFSTC